MLILNRVLDGMNFRAPPGKASIVCEMALHSDYSGAANDVGVGSLVAFKYHCCSCEDEPTNSTIKSFYLQIYILTLSNICWKLWRARRSPNEPKNRERAKRYTRCECLCS